MTRSRNNCPVEDTLGPELSLELDAYLADPKRWPKAVFEGWDLPPGQLPGAFRQWGGVKLGIEWCRSRGFAVTKASMNRHWREHVPILPSSPTDYAITAAEAPGRLPGRVPTNVVTYTQVYEKGLAIGAKALDRLSDRIDALEKAGTPIPTDLLLKMADLGTKLATSQASILARGLKIGDEQDDEIEGFRSGSSPLPSARFGHSRVRVIDGEAKPVHDEGRADRRHYNERARQEGSPELPA